MAVFGLVSSVAGFVKVRYLIDKAIIDNMIFRCHYRITSAILFVCCIIVTANNLIGKWEKTGEISRWKRQNENLIKYLQAIPSIALMMALYLAMSSTHIAGSPTLSHCLDNTENKLERKSHHQAWGMTIKIEPTTVTTSGSPLLCSSK